MTISDSLILRPLEIKDVRSKFTSRDSGYLEFIEEGKCEMVNILLVENDESHRCLIKANLKRPGLRFLEAGNDLEGLKILGEQKPDLVLMDIRMPRGYNWSLLEKLKNKPDTRGIPVIILTVADEKARAMAMGADSYIRKPFNSYALRQEVERLLSFAGPAINYPSI
ncbi:MAG: two-component system response regulator [Dehalococcoidia bacterium]|nr:two-component system response regulator [Dehalococcoidia bacterium]